MRSTFAIAIAAIAGNADAFTSCSGVSLARHCSTTKHCLAHRKTRSHEAPTASRNAAASSSRGARRSRTITSGSLKASGGSMSMLDATDVFQIQQWAGDVAATELTHVSPLTIGVMYGTGLLMSLSPCALSLLPLTMSYIAGTEAEEGAGKGFDSVRGGFFPSAAFAAGLATVLSLLGISASFAGKVMGSGAEDSALGSTIVPLAASAFAVAMGLNVLELIKLDLPSFEGGMEYMTSLPRNARAYMLGASSALVASPCCTPVLASILGFIGSSQDPLLGLALLLTYSAGYTTPLMAAGTASGVLSRLMSANGLNWITPVSGAVLISYGTYSGLNTLFG